MTSSSWVALSQPINHRCSVRGIELAVINMMTILTWTNLLRMSKSSVKSIKKYINYICKDSVVASTRELQAKIFKDSEAHKRQMTSTSIKSGDKMTEWQQDQEEAIRQLLVAQKPQ